MSKRKELIEKRNDLITRADELGQANETRELTVAEMAELAEIRDSIRDIKRKLGVADKIDEISREAAPATRDEGEAEAEPAAEDKETEAAEERAFEAELRGMWNDMNTRDDNTPLSKGANGAIIPVTIAKRIIRKLYDISPILERSTKYDVKGTLAIPYYSEDSTDNINVAFQGAEFSKLSANSGKFTSINLTGYVAGALALVSRSLINNVDFDLVGYVVDQMAYSIKRFIEGVLINGSGAITGQTGTVAGLTGVTLTTNSAAATAVTADELIELHDSVKDMFQEGAVWIMSPATRTAIRQLKDKMGRYMLQDDISLPFGVSLLGKPVYVSDNMPEMAQGNAAIYYGNLAGLATKFSENMEIQVLREKYADQHADGVIAWFEFDAKVQDAQQIAKLVMGSGTPESE
jgi:HK97 family phage major capsid protein